jgi:amidase
MQAGRTTSKAITQQYLARIKAIDKAGPKLNSVIEVNPDA